ncbi:NADH/ubiquinone/plastoquinone (complex I) [bacterium]|nr:MAG: NADH/ubiquinone/plastoquinone (complex I) [bacterium]
MTLPIFIIIPLAAAFLISLVGRKKDFWGPLLAIAATVAVFVLSLITFFQLGAGIRVYEMGGWKMPFGIALVLDPFGAFMLIIVALISLTSLLFSVSYIRHLGSDWKYYALFMILVSGMNGVLITGDLFNLFVFTEIALFAAYGLVAYGGRAHEFEAAFKYAVMASVSSSLILLAIAVVYSATSTLTMAHISVAMSSVGPGLKIWIGALFLAGYGLKAAIMPFHAWLPDAHSSAPAPISSMLSGVLIKTLGVYVLVRIFYNILGAPQVFLTAFMILGTLSIVLGVILAIGQWDFKRLLAYSSISQVGYIFLGIGLNSTLGIAGALFHLLNHALFKSLLFYNAGSLEMGLGTRDLRKMGNITRLLPITARSSMAASLAISGIPPFNGFFSKLLIIIAAVQAHQPVYALLAVIGSLLTLATFMKVQRYGIRGENPVERLQSQPGWGMQAAMIILAVLCILTSLLIVPGIKESVLDPVVAAVMDKTGYAAAVLGGR